MEHVRTAFSAALLLLLFTCSQLMGQDWEQLPGPTGGEITALLKTPAGALLAWQIGGGIYRSQDSTRSWTRVLNHTNHRPTDPLTIDPQGRIYCSSTDGLVRSDDDGRTWISLTNPGTHVLGITPRGTLLAAGYRSILRSTDGGMRWDSSAYAPTRYGSYAVGIGVTDDSTCFAAFERDSLVRSIDDGATWELAYLPPGCGELVYMTIIDGSDILVSADSGCWISRDGAVSWEKADIPDGGTVLQARHSGRNIILARTADALLKSSDGVEWIPIDIPATAAVTSALALDDHVMLYGDGYGLFYSTDVGRSWERRTTNMFIPRWYLSLDERPDARLVSLPWISYDHGEQWEPARWDSGRFKNGSICQRSDGSMDFVGTDEFGRSGLWHADGRNAVWSWIDTIPFPFYNMTMTDIPGGIIAMNSSGDIWVTTDAGARWESRGTLPQDSTGLRLLDLHAMHPPYDDIVLAAVGIKGILRSSNQGMDWETVPIEGSGPVWVKRIIELPDGSLIAASWFDIFRSTDQGQTWKLVQTAALPANIGTVLTDRLSNLYEYRPEAGAPDELWMYTSTDRGDHWLPVDLPPPPVPKQDITGITFDDMFRLCISTELDGIYRLRTPLLDRHLAPAAVTTLRIDAMYPQPLRTSQHLVVRCDIPEAAALHVSVFDMTGRERYSAEHAATTPGSRHLQIPPLQLPAGVYQLRLQTANAVTARVFSILR